MAAASAPSAASAALPPLVPEVSAFIELLRARGVKAVVLDMDCTLVSNHSGGCVPADELLQFTQSITGCARRLIPHLLAEGFHVAVATFADDMYSSYGGAPKGSFIAGVELVQCVLKELPCFAGAQQAAALDAVPIVTINPGLYSVDEVRTQSAEQRRMKQTNLPPAAQKLRTFFHEKIASFGIDEKHADWESCSVFPPLPFKNHHLLLISKRLGVKLNECILIDDRDENVAAAVQFGAWGLFLTRKRGLLLADLAEKQLKEPATASSSGQ